MTPPNDKIGQGFHTFAESVDAAQAAYWLGSVTRREAQDSFDEYSAAIQQVRLTTVKLDLCVAFLMEKLGVTPEQVQEFVTRKQSELEAIHAASSKLVTEN